jgi:hypothetical protein
MKVLSVWQPYASLTIHGFKKVETRSYPAPTALHYPSLMPLAQVKGRRRPAELGVHDELERIHDFIRITGEEPATAETLPSEPPEEAVGGP